MEVGLVMAVKDLACVEVEVLDCAEVEVLGRVGVVLDLVLESVSVKDRLVVPGLLVEVLD